MSEGVFTMPLVTAGAGAFAKTTDSFKRATSGVAVGTAGISISSKPGRFYRAVVENGGATAYYLQVFDKATAAINADVPVYEKRLAASGECELDLVNVNGVPCLNGISLAISTTPGTLTLAAATDVAYYSVFYTASQ
jgi:hypothetical protein